MSCRRLRRWYSACSRACLRCGRVTSSRRTVSRCSDVRRSWVASIVELVRLSSLGAAAPAAGARAPEDHSRSAGSEGWFPARVRGQSASGQGCLTRLPAILAAHELPPRWVLILERLHEHFKYLTGQIDEIGQELARQLADDDIGPRLLSIPGVGPVTASVLAADMGDGKHYGCSRNFAASVGLVPRQYSTGGKANLLGISRRRDKTVCDKRGLF